MRMGSGYFPTVLSAILVGFGAFLMARGARSKERAAVTWGWTKKYVEFLQGKLKSPIPAFYLAAWLFRMRDWPPSTKPATNITATRRTAPPLAKRI